MACAHNLNELQVVIDDKMSRLFKRESTSDL